MFRLLFLSMFIYLISPAHAGTHYLKIQQSELDDKKNLVHSFMCSPDIDTCSYDIPLHLTNKSNNEDYIENLKIYVHIKNNIAEFYFVFMDSPIVTSYSGVSIFSKSLDDLQSEEQKVKLYILNPVYLTDPVKYAVVRPNNTHVTDLVISMASPEHTLEDIATPPNSF